MYNTTANPAARGIYLPDGSLHRFAEKSQVKSLSDHVASRGRSPDFTALGMYLPNPDPILKKMGKDTATYRDLLSDAHIGGMVRRRKSVVRSMEWRLVDGKQSENSTTAGNGRQVQKASPRAMAQGYDALEAMDMDTLMVDILSATLFGWTPIELMWQRGTGKGSGAWLPTAALAKPQEWFHFDPEGQLRFKSREHPMFGEALQPRKFLLPRQDASYANPYGFADLSMCFWPTTFKRGGLKFWVTFAEKFGTPWIVGKQPRGAGAGESDKLLDQLEDMVQDAVAVIPDDASVEITQASGKSDAAGAYKELLMFCRSEVSIALLGQNQSTEASSTNASATAGLEVGKDLRDGDARLVETTINQLLRWVTDLNEGEAAPAPRFELFEQEEVSEVQAKRDEALSRAGVTFTPQYWQRTYGLQQGDIVESVIPAKAGIHKPAEAKPSFAEGGMDSRLRGNDGSEDKDALDALDALVDDALNDPDSGWQQIMQPQLDLLQTAIDQAVAKGETASELIARLPGLLAHMPVDGLATALATASARARMAGLAGIPTDDEPQQA